MDIQDIDSLKKLDEGEWRIYIANKIDKVLPIAAAVTTLSGRLDNLPCNNHTTALKSLNDWRNKCEDMDSDKELETLKGGISLKNALIGGIGIAGVTTILNIIINLIFTGKP